jgi:hypothetical protein
LGAWKLIGDVMNTLVTIIEIALGTAVLVTGLAGPLTRGAGPEVPGRSLTTYADAQVGAVNGLFGAAFALAAVVLGVSVLAGAVVVPIPVGVVVTVVGLISVLLGVPAGSPINSVAEDRVAASNEDRVAAMVRPRGRTSRPVAAGEVPSRAA